MRKTVRTGLIAIAVASLVFGGVHAQPQRGAAQNGSVGNELPGRLSETGLYAPGSLQVRADVLPFSPQYPLWSDGASKRRWIYLPPGSAIDGTNVDAWDFPAGTRIWKEFSYGRPIETRFIERLADGSWRFAAYVWNEEGTDALLAPEFGRSVLQVDAAPGQRYVVPSRDDCLACHEGASVPVLGFSALQLAVDRDMQAPHADTKRAEDVDLAELVRRGLVEIADPASINTSPSLPASSPLARTALGYLHANCGHCHNDRGPLADVGLFLSQRLADQAGENRVLQSTVDRAADSSAYGLTTRVVAGRPDESLLLARMKSRNPYNQMPPLGSQVADSDALRIIEQWIQQLSDTKGDAK